MKTIVPKYSQLQQRQFWVVDIKGHTLGRVAARIALILRGKHKAYMMPGCDTGDFVYVTNANKFNVTGGKMHKKIYHKHTGYIGGLVSTPLNKLIERDPLAAVRKAVKGMMPRGALSRTQLKRLRVIAGEKCPHHQAKNIVIQNDKVGIAS